MKIYMTLNDRRVCVPAGQAVLDGKTDVLYTGGRLGRFVGLDVDPKSQELRQIWARRGLLGLF